MTCLENKGIRSSLESVRKVHLDDINREGVNQWAQGRNIIKESDEPQRPGEEVKRNKQVALNHELSVDGGLDGPSARRGSPM